MSPALLAAVVAALAFVLTLVLTPLVRGAAITGGMVRPTQADRWHRRPTPAIGGVAIYLGFGLALGAGFLLSPASAAPAAARPARSLLAWTPAEGLLVAGTVAFLVGLVDDFLHLRPWQKLLGQLVAASALIFSGIGVWFTGVYAADVAVSLLWFVGITNALNLLDNMDGLATGTAAIAAAFLAALFLMEGQWGMLTVAVGLMGALLGFLTHNYPPARIFMGDSGSLFLGITLAGLALAPAPGLSRSLAAVLVAPALILGVPILDTTLVTIGRLLEGRPVSEGGKDHTSHRIVDLGIPERKTLWILWALALLGGGVGLLLRTAQRGTAILLGGVLLALLTMLGAYLVSLRFRKMAADEAARMTFYRFLVEGQERWPVFALLLDGVWIALAYYAAYLLRWDAGQLPAELAYFQRSVALVVGAKLLGFVLSGLYGSRWGRFGLYDAMRAVQANFVGSALAVGLLLVVERVGLSRGVMGIDFLVCTLLTLGARVSFRLLEGGAERWSEEGVPVVVHGSFADVEMALAELHHAAHPRLRPVALAVPAYGRARGRFQGHRLYGGSAALRHALQENGAHAVVVVSRAGTVDSWEYVRAHLESRGGLDVYRVRVGLERADDLTGRTAEGVT